MNTNFITSTTLEGLDWLGSGQRAIERWDLLNRELAARLGEECAQLLAEPQAHSDSPNTYSWFTVIEGSAVACRELAEHDQLKLKSDAESLLRRIRDLIDRLASQAGSDRQLGAALSAAITVPPHRLGDLLFSVGGKPVLVNWGTWDQGSAEPPQPLQIEIHRPTPPSPPTPPPPIVTTVPVESRSPWPHPLWLLLVILCCTSFWRLLEGCAFSTLLGGAPNFCHVDRASLDAEWLDVQAETNALTDKLAVLQRSALQAPMCGLDGPAYFPRNGLQLAKPGESAADWSAAKHLEYNNLIQAAGGDPAGCDGIDVMARWQTEADIDLRVYAVDESLGEGEIPSEKIVDAYNPSSNGVVYTLESDGSGTGEHLERICIGAAAPVMGYFATFDHKISNPSGQQPVNVQLAYRGGGVAQDIVVVSTPGEESKDGLQISYVDH